MTAADPYEAPRASALEATTAPALGWRGAAWFVLPLWVGLLLLAEAIDPGSLSRSTWKDLAGLLLVGLTGAPIGLAAGQRCRLRSWRRFLLLSLRDGVIWALVTGLAVWAIAFAYGKNPNAPDPAAVAITIGRLSLLTIPLTLVLASTMRGWYSRRP